MFEAKCPCGCGRGADKTPRYRVAVGGEITLADLPVGAHGKVLKIRPELRGRKKFADVGLVAGSELCMEAHAPFGGLLRVRVMESSMALHRDDAENILMTGSAK